MLAQEGDGLQSLGIQVPMLGRRSVLGRADHIVSLGRSVAQAQEAVDRFTRALHRKGMVWKPTSMQFVLVGSHGEATGDAGVKRPADDELSAGQLTWSTREGEGPPFERVCGLEVLRCEGKCSALGTPRLPLPLQQCHSMARQAH